MAFFVNPDYVQERGWKYYYAQNGISGVVDYVKTFNPMMVLYLGLTALFNIFIFYCLIRFYLQETLPSPTELFSDTDSLHRYLHGSSWLQPL
ncbi:MAG: hypothetical protein HS118_00940 [Bacteroidia bacterium]|nr:hypothetical protein [Bacteroidia bacterium]